MKKLKLHLNRTGGGMFHDSRADSRLLAKCVNQMSEKIDELIDVIESQQKEIVKLKENLNQ